MADRDELVTFYFNLGLSQNEITNSLALRHDIFMSERHLRRILKKLKLYRRKYFSDIIDVADYVDTELSKSGCLHGYRWFHLKCVQNGFVVSQEMIRMLLKILDPTGVEMRKHKRLRRRQYKNKGPDFMWHMDGYDKLTPYGIGIHGCVDGFSRNIIWLEAYNTNRNPQVIAGYFIDAVNARMGCPSRIRFDEGTENGHVRQLQQFLRRNHNDPFADDKSYLYGRSTANQRIESWWGILRKQCSQFWMNLFEELKDDGYFSGDFIDKCLMQFCFLRLIQNELDDVAMVWNVHKIRPTRNQRAPHGRPIVMYQTPELFHTHGYVCDSSLQDIRRCREEVTEKSANPCDKDIFELSCIVMEEQGILNAPNDPYEAINLYVALRNAMHALI